MINYNKKIKELISEKAGLEPHEITDESYFGDDLNLGALEIAEIVEELEELYDIDLSEYQGEMETVADLVTAVSENLEL